MSFSTWPLRACSPRALAAIMAEMEPEAARVLTAAGYLVGLDGSELLTVGRPDSAAQPDAVARVLGEAGLWPTELAPVAESLEDVFLRLTGRSLVE